MGISNNALQAAMQKVKQAISAGKAEYIQLNMREQTLTEERKNLPNKCFPMQALRDEIAEHANAAIDEAADKLSKFISDNVICFATHRAPNLPIHYKHLEGRPISVARFDSEKDGSKNSKDRPHLLPGMRVESLPIDPLIMAVVLLGQLEDKTPADAFADILNSLSDRSLGYDRVVESNVGTDRVAMVARIAAIDAELETIKKRKADLLEEMQALGVNTQKLSWMHEKDAQ